MNRGLFFPYVIFTFLHLRTISCVCYIVTSAHYLIIETLANTARPVAQPVWNHVGQPIWSRVGDPVWQYVGRPVWRHLGRPICSISSRLLSTVLLLVYHLIWTYSLRYIVTSSTSVSRKMLRASRFVMVKTFIWEMGIFSR